jgi:hypothetical protein
MQATSSRTNSRTDESFRNQLKKKTDIEDKNSIAIEEMTARLRIKHYCPRTRQEKTVQLAIAKMPSYPSPKPKSKNNHLKVTSEGVRRTLRSTDNPGAAGTHRGRVAGSHRNEEGDSVEGQLPAHRVNETRTTGPSPIGSVDTQQSGVNARGKTLPMDLEEATTGPNHLDVTHDDEAMLTADSSRNDTTGYEGEEQLNREHSEEDWKEFETRFRQTNVMIAFSIDEPTILVPQHGYWGLPD